uniref:Uncharacterized protein n=1 Tax=Anguilla anguilla TaxID=7936 RepID=A0A0E9WAR8_ANGAN
MRKADGTLVILNISSCVIVNFVAYFTLFFYEHVCFPLQKDEVPPRFELGSLDSKSRVLTITPWDLIAPALVRSNLGHLHVLLKRLKIMTCRQTCKNTSNRRRAS